MKKKYQYWLPILIVAVIYVLESATTMLQFKAELTADYFTQYAQLLKVVNGLKVIVFCASYFLTALVVKKRKNALWFVGFYLIAFFFPFFLKNLGIADSLYSLVAIFNQSFYGVVLYLGFDWYRKEQRNKELEKQNLQSELALLKNQINPHFLFNTLNNIDSLIKTTPNHASQSLIELSEIMRYMLYETNTDRVLLKKELDYIENYLALQKLQQANSQLVNYSITGEPEDIKVAPMLFMSFIENAFKHCTDKEQAGAICFSFNITPKQIHFQSTNIANDNHLISKDSSSGIGLETVKRRLEILYPNNYSLQIDKKNDLFCVSLSLTVDADD
jgi:hypothetical protein